MLLEGHCWFCFSRGRAGTNAQVVTQSLAAYLSGVLVVAPGWPAKCTWKGQHPPLTSTTIFLQANWQH